MEGPKTQTTFQLLAPSGETLPYKPARFKRETDMVLWPKEPEIDSMDNNNNNPIMGNATLDFSMDEKAMEDGDKMVQLKNGTTIHLVAAPPLPKQNKAK